jgi:hypothetical protein
MPRRLQGGAIVGDHQQSHKTRSERYGLLRDGKPRDRAGLDTAKQPLALIAHQIHLHPSPRLVFEAQVE